MNLGGFGKKQDNDGIERLDELARNNPEDIASMRSSSRYTAQCDIVVRPANVRDRGGDGVQGSTADVSEGGCRIVVKKPLCPGDVILIEFDRTALDIPPPFGQIVRCQMFQDDSFEVGVRFIRPVDSAALTDLNDEAAIDELI